MTIPPKGAIKLETWRVDQGGEIHQAQDLVAAEEPLEIRVVHVDQGRSVSTPVAVTMRTPGHDFDLAAGFLFTEGIIHGPETVARIGYCTDGPADQENNVVNVYLRPDAAFDPALVSRNFYMTSSCGVCGKASLDTLRVQGCRPVASGPLTVDAATLCRLFDELRRPQAVFEATGGLHAAGLFDATGSLLVLREDVGRHNAVDKVIGHRLLAGDLPLSDAVLVVSGRTSFEIMQKAAMAGVPLVAAVGAPSSLAVETALEFGMTLVGFLRPDRFNVYTGPQRIQR
jgi:FdhD protein